MTDQEILTLLIYLNELDGRHSPNEIKVKAWADVFSESAPDMPLQFARSAARKHYSLLDDMCTPAVIVRAWKRNNSGKHDGSEVSDAHCRKAGCSCSHNVCYRGWIDLDNGTTKPCGVCRDSLARVLAEIPPPGMRSDHDFSRIRNRFNQDGEGHG